MIVSYLHNFIFIKTKKTGGTAVEMALAPACGPDDVITPLGVKEELDRGGDEVLCRNFSADRALEEQLRNAIVSRSRRELIRYTKLLRRGDFYNHMPAATMKEKIDPAFWNAAYKITIERHPYEKAVSQAYFKYKNDQPFEEFLERFLKLGKYSSRAFYTVDGKIVVDDFLRQETLSEDLKRLAKRQGFSLPDRMPTPKTRSRTDRRPAREILTPEQKDIVYSFCREEFELLGYER
jgi:hypothetical protein